MKVCSRCGYEISTRDGVNICQNCEKRPFRKTKQKKADLDYLRSSLGLVKVKGALGGTYWE